MFLRSQDSEQFASVAQTLAGGEIDVPDLNDDDRLLLDYARKLTLSPAEMTDADSRALREAGFTDEQVWEATFTTAIFAMFNRMADAFGLEPPASSVRALHRG